MKLIKKVDLLKIGVFLIGIAMLMMAGILLHLYIKTITTESSWKPSKFYASCDSKNSVIIISARETITNVTVKDKNGTIICKFSKINANSEEMCTIEIPGVFTVESEGTKKVVSCYEIEEMKPVAID